MRSENVKEIFSSSADRAFIHKLSVAPDLIGCGRDQAGDIADPLDRDGRDDVPMRFVDRDDTFRAAIQDVTVSPTRRYPCRPRKATDSAKETQ
jgi:hypothetical protein